MNSETLEKNLLSITSLWNTGNKEHFKEYIPDGRYTYTDNLRGFSLYTNVPFDGLFW
jgi:hypothetical protein